jgi:hypothetical protein
MTNPLPLGFRLGAYHVLNRLLESQEIRRPLEVHLTVQVGACGAGKRRCGTQIIIVSYDLMIKSQRTGGIAVDLNRRRDRSREQKSRQDG